MASRLSFTIKRAVDVVVAGSGLVVFSPIIVTIAILVRVKLGRPVLFPQARPGLHSRPFILVKFRTMTRVEVGDGTVLADENRMTPFGSTLRRWSLDELPQLWNVLRGDLSLVGPRPLLIEYLPLYSTDQARRHDMRPGMTGWAQVNGRNAIGWDEKLALDTWYVDHWSLRLDFRILARTCVKVLRREGISEDGVATKTRFTGTSAISDGL